MSVAGISSDGVLASVAVPSAGALPGGVAPSLTGRRSVGPAVSRSSGGCDAGGFGRRCAGASGRRCAGGRSAGGRSTGGAVSRSGTGSGFGGAVAGPEEKLIPPPAW